MRAAMPANKDSKTVSLALGPRASRVALVMLILAAVCISLLAQFSNLDLDLADAIYDRGIDEFPWRHAWVAERFNHVLLKRVLVGLAAIIILLNVWDVARPRAWTPLRRLQVRIVAMSAVLVPLIVATLKQISSSHCPWDIDRYGGDAPYVRLLDTLPVGVEAGHCMPGGHASSALWLISVGVLFLPGRPGLAMMSFGMMLSFGMAVGWVQQMRGAHFFTHTLWSAWIACAVLFILVQCQMVRKPETGCS